MLFFVQNKAMLSTSLHCTVFSDKGKELLRWPIKILGCVHSPSPLLSRLSFKGGLLSFRIWLFKLRESIYAHYCNLCQFNVAQPQPLVDQSLILDLLKGMTESHKKYHMAFEFWSDMVRRWQRGDDGVLKSGPWNNAFLRCQNLLSFKPLIIPIQVQRALTHAQAMTKLNQFQCQSIEIF